MRRTKAVLLDIGAGGKGFARAFRWHNPTLELLCLCGEPEYYHYEWSGDFFKGITKLRASYDAFNVPDRSLDIVMLNAFEFPFCYPAGIERELVRCLRPGGLFFSAHPIGIHPEVPEEHFAPVEFESRTSLYFDQFRRSRIRFRWGRRIITYPPSRTIRNRLRLLQYSEGKPIHNNAYSYSGMAGGPNLRVWVRNNA